RLTEANVAEAMLPGPSYRGHAKNARLMPGISFSGIMLPLLSRAVGASERWWALPFRLRGTILERYRNERIHEGYRRQPARLRDGDGQYGNRLCRAGAGRPAIGPERRRPGP